MSQHPQNRTSDSSYRREIDPFPQAAAHHRKEDGALASHEVGDVLCHEVLGQELLIAASFPLCSQTDNAVPRDAVRGPQLVHMTLVQAVSHGAQLAR